MANPEHVELVRKGAGAIAEWEREHNEALDLSGADLSEADLSRADLSEADLSGADLTRVDLMWAILGGADLSRADVSGAWFGGTSLIDVDLSQVSGLAAAKHQFPSGVGIDTLMTSVRGAGDKLTPELEAFFRGAGVPDELLKEVTRIVARIRYDSCFISYGQPDLVFATKLYEDLKSKRVRCWLYEMDKTPGERTWGEISARRREADRMVVLCSSEALLRDGVLKEIEEQVDEDPDKLIPISLDDLWKKHGFPAKRGDRDLKPFLLERNHADFTGWDSDPERYEKGLDALLRGLRREKPPE